MLVGAAGIKNVAGWRDPKPLSSVTRSGNQMPVLPKVTLVSLILVAIWQSALIVVIARLVIAEVG